MFSVGTDLVEIQRIEKSMRNPRFLEKILGEEEYSQLKARGFPAQSVAANFCAKEAFVKAIGLGFTAGVKLKDVEILRNTVGRPVIKLHGKARELQQVLHQNYSVSLTHTREYASAVVIAWAK